MITMFGRTAVVAACPANMKLAARQTGSAKSAKNLEWYKRRAAIPFTRATLPEYSRHSKD
jgi:hypothetical protein